MFIGHLANLAEDAGGDQPGLLAVLAFGDLAGRWAAYRSTVRR